LPALQNGHENVVSSFGRCFLGGAFVVLFFFAIVILYQNNDSKWQNYVWKVVTIKIINFADSNAPVSFLNTQYLPRSAIKGRQFEIEAKGVEDINLSQLVSIALYPREIQSVLAELYSIEPP